MNKIMKISSADEVSEISFEELLERYYAFIANEARKAKISWLSNDSITDVDDIKQELMIELYRAFNEYDISKGVFTTFWQYKFKGYRAHKISNNTRQKRGGYIDEDGKSKSVSHVGIEFKSESGEVLPIIDPSLEIDSFEGGSLLIETLKGFRVKNDVERALLDNMIDMRFNTVQSIAESLGVSRQYVNIVKKNLVLRIQKELEEF